MLYQLLHESEGLWLSSRKSKTGYSIVKLSDSIDKPADVAELVDALDLGSSVLVT